MGFRVKFLGAGKVLTKISCEGQRRGMCKGSEAGSYLRLIDFAYHSTLGLRVITKKEEHARFTV